MPCHDVSVSVSVSVAHENNTMMKTKAILLTLSTHIFVAASFVPQCIPLSRALLASKARDAPQVHRDDESSYHDAVFDGSGKSEMIGHDAAYLFQKHRRSFISSLATSAVFGLPASPAHAAKGAAEYDLEYYMRDLL